jgi:hypothetical protein
MTQSENAQPTSKLDFLVKYVSSLSQSISPIRWLGYGFLIFSALDLAAIFYPPEFTNPVWEFQVVGQVVERVAVPLIGFVLIFFGGSDRRSKIERRVLPLLSWLALVSALLYLALIGLGISSAIRIHRESTKNITERVNQTEAQIQEIEKQLKGATTIDEMEAFLGRLNQGRAPEIASQEQFEEVKGRLTTSLAQGKQRLQNQAQATQSNQRRALLKNGVKWNLGALLSAVLFWIMWRGSRWARRPGTW